MHFCSCFQVCYFNYQGQKHGYESCEDSTHTAQLSNPFTLWYSLSKNSSTEKQALCNTATEVLNGVPKHHPIYQINNQLGKETKFAHGNSV